MGLLFFKTHLGKKKKKKNRRAILEKLNDHRLGLWLNPNEDLVELRAAISR